MSAKSGGQIEVESESARCACCDLTEECTPEYISKVRETHQGRWICGLCDEAIKDEIYRSRRAISTEEAIDRHMSFSKSFRSASPPSNASERLITAVSRLLRRSLDSPREARSTPTTPRMDVAAESSAAAGSHRGSELPRSESCFSAFAR
ncbi:uncharacterized protein [Typha latifolia]|uniref:uncharacterized protein n=1 Tax=Typha latifolia TaxID=4733 RepID=UPI003C2DC141